jgi:hypothetical protein
MSPAGLSYIRKFYHKSSRLREPASIKVPGVWKLRMQPKEHVKGDENDKRGGIA